MIKMVILKKDDVDLIINFINFNWTIEKKNNTIIDYDSMEKSKISFFILLLFGVF
jgi:hypothetical protein